MVAALMQDSREPAGAMQPSSAKAASSETDASKERSLQTLGTADRRSRLFQQDAARRESVDSVNASSSCRRPASATSASAYVVIGECRRVLQAGLTLQQFWEALPPLADPEQCLCSLGTGLVPTCGKVKGGGGSLPASMSSHGRGVEMQRRRAKERRAQLVLLQGMQKEAGKQAEQRSCAQGDREQLQAQDDAQSQGLKQDLLLPLLVARAGVEVGSPGRAEVLFRAHDTLSPGLTYCAYAPKHRSLAQTQSRVQSQAQPHERITSHSLTEAQRPLPLDQPGDTKQECTLRLPNGSTRTLPGGVTLGRAVEILRESERESQGRPSTARTDRNSLTNAASITRTDSLGLVLEGSAGALSTTGQGPKVQGAGAPEARVPLPLLLLARTDAGCQVLLQPGDELQPGVEYLVRLRPTQGKHRGLTQLPGTGAGSKGALGSHAGRGPGAGLTEALGVRISDPDAGRGGGASVWAVEAAMNRPPTPVAGAGASSGLPGARASTTAAQASAYFFRGPVQSSGGVRGGPGTGRGGFGAVAMARPATADPRQGRSRGLGRGAPGGAGAQGQAQGSSMLDGAMKTWSMFFGQK